MKKVIAILALGLTTTFAFAQDIPLEISGSVDTYYKYDFAKTATIPTSFATDHNSVSLGMIAIALKKKTGKTSFVGEVSFGPRGQFQSIPNADGTYDDVNSNSFHIQNLYATYAASEKLSLTAGYMATFIGYEVISPVGNYNYSTSYLFTNGPFQNAGIKANYTISSKLSLMAGLFNDQWNTYKATPKSGLNAFGAQLAITPVEGLIAYFNLLTGSESGTIVDLIAAYQISPKFKLGLNAADFSAPSKGTGYSGFALYPSVAITDSFGLGLRAEAFKSKTIATTFTSCTLSANLKSGSLTLIPEIRLNTASEESFFADNGNATKTASQFAVALVYGF